MRKYFAMAFIIGSTISLIFIVHHHYTQIDSVVCITNSRWDRVHIQVGRADNNNTADKILFDQYLNKGQSRAFTLSDSDDIVYRRDLDPEHPDGKHFTAWTPANYDGSSVCSIDNP